MAGITIESLPKAIAVITIMIVILMPFLYSVLPASTANQLNITGLNSSNQLNNLVFGQVTGVALNKTGGLNQNPTAGGGIFQGFAFVMQGFGLAVTAIVQTPYILGTLGGTLISQFGLTTQGQAALVNEMTSFTAFLFIIIGISAYMKYPLRSG